MGFALRTPLMIAALYGSIDILKYILESDLEIDVNLRSETDGATAFDLAAAGGAKTRFEAIRCLSDFLPADSVSAHNFPDLESSLKSTVAIENKKKEYPLDLTLPDIKNGLYGTDEFRMYTFKVKPCSRAYSHDWTECPFVHPGENARRRDLKKYVYSCVPCPEFRKGTCAKGDNCEYAHGVFESWLHPAQYRTRLCKDEVGCNRKICFFAHKVEELRSVNPNGLGCSSPTSMSGLDPYMFAPSSPVSSPGPFMNTQIPALQLPNSRLKSSLSFRDIDVNMTLEHYRQNLIEQIQTVSSPLSYGQSMNHHMYNNYPSSPTVNSSSAAMAKAIINSRAASFAQRSQSFIDRGANFSPTKKVSLNWGSPNGKLDWGMEGEELNKFKKSASFATRKESNVYEEEPDMSWVHSLIKDEPVKARGEFVY